MARPKNRNLCELHKCDRLKMNGGKVGYRIDDKVYEIYICMYHVELLQMAPRGTWHITKNKELKAIPATKIII